jgi:hypothetical protein
MWDLLYFVPHQILDFAGAPHPFAGVIDVIQLRQFTQRANVGPITRYDFATQCVLPLAHLGSVAAVGVAAAIHAPLIATTIGTVTIGLGITKGAVFIYDHLPYNEILLFTRRNTIHA